MKIIINLSQGYEPGQCERMQNSIRQLGKQLQWSLKVKKELQKEQVRKGHEGETWEWESIPSEEGGLSPVFSEQPEEPWPMHLQCE